MTWTGFRTEIPVIVVHISGHFSVMNSAGLAKVGYSAATKDPEGGVIRRRPGSREPNGVLEGAAHFPVMVPAISPSTLEDADYYLKRGLELAKSYGHTTVSEGRLFGPQQAGLASAAERGLLDIDVNSYVDYLDRRLITAPWFGREYRNRYRIAGMKIALDGSPQGRTAWRTIPYLIPPDGQKAGYKGYPVIPDTKVIEDVFDEAYRNGWPDSRACQWRCGHRPADCRTPARAREARSRRPAVHADSWPVRAPGPARFAEGTAGHPFAVPDAHLLLG